MCIRDSHNVAQTLVPKKLTNGREEVAMSAGEAGQAKEAGILIAYRGHNLCRRAPKPSVDDLVTGIA